MILIGIGANLPSPRLGPPLATCEAALRALAQEGLRVIRRSRWYRSQPVPPSDQPWFINGVAVLALEGAPEPLPLLALLHAVEASFGRVRGERDAARVLDLDLLAHGDRLIDPGKEGLVLPHPRLHERAFVLLPLSEVAPGWRHPRLGAPLDELIARLPPGQVAEPLASS